MEHFYAAVNDALRVQNRARRRAVERARKRRRGFACAVAAVLILCFLISGFCVDMFANSNVRTSVITASFKSKGEDFAGRDVRPADQAAVYSVKQSLDIYSEKAVLWDLDKGIALYEKNSKARMYPASLTKIMTAVVAVENIRDLNEEVLLNEQMFWPVYTMNASTAGFSPDENVRAIDLLYGLLLPSGVECAAGLAEYVAGSENAFTDLMNEKAWQLGMKDSHFTNASGLHDENHYSSASDIAKLFSYAIYNPVIFEIITCDRYTTAPTNKHKNGVSFESILFSKMKSAEFPGGRVLGGKTGYTNEAGQCLASIAVKNDRLYLLVTAGASLGAPGGAGGAEGGYGADSLNVADAFTVYSTLCRQE